MSTDTPHPETLSEQTDEAIDELLDKLDQILSDLRTRDDETPQWEFCEGFMAALICCRRPIPATEYLPVLFEMSPFEDGAKSSFTDQAQLDGFMALWHQRWNQLVQALDSDVEDLTDEHAYVPSLLDMRGAVASMTAEQRAEMEAEVGELQVPSYGQIWAVGFMYAVENWPEEWAAPRGRETAKLMDAALQSILVLTEDDTDPPSDSLSDEEGSVATISQQRMDNLADALWATYDLRALWRQIGPRVEIVHRTATPGRNDPCSCGSGKKYKKCCGAS